MVGYGTTSTGQEEAFYLDGHGGSALLAAPGATQTYANGLNNIGQIVGDYVDAAGSTHGFLFDLTTGAYTTLDNPNAKGFTVAEQINDSLQVAGIYTDANNVRHGMEIQIAHT